MAEGLPFATSYRELIVYRKARSLAREVFDLTRRFPKDETYSLTDQVRRSSRAVGANIAEAWGKRRYEKHFASKLTDADAERLETQHWLDIAADCGYISGQQSRALLANCEEIGRLLGGMIVRADSFCTPSSLREPSVEYFVTPSKDNDH